MKMIKYLFVPIFLFSSLFAIDIEEVEDKSINENKASYVKDGRLILNPIKNPILNVMSKNDFKKIGKSLKKKDSKRKVNDKITNSKPKENDKITNLKPKENDKITNLKPKEKIVYK
ncbi:MAG: hypothetical protein KAJ49_06140, partial [Arcobacteraceae bacterium]|nr:hypothetical protein [Arcobacteraceae bacterium]